MKKLGFLIVLAIGMFLTYMPANAQQTSSASVTTDVQAALSITKSQDIIFGTIGNTSDPKLDPTGQSNQDVGSTAQVGVFDISGATSGTVFVNYNSTVTLSDGATPTAHTIIFHPNVTGDASSSNQNGSGSNPVTSGSTVTLSSASTGVYTLWVGGELGTVGTGISGQAAGIILQLLVSMFIINNK